jgi:NAD/NADP transhydrogenase alpha subunit
VSPELLSALTVFVLAILVGFAVISKVPATLHTPLMSGANSIHGIVLVGSMFIAIEATTNSQVCRHRRRSAMNVVSNRNRHRPDAQDVRRSRPPKPTEQAEG